MKIGPGGETLKDRQQQWRGDPIMQFALFAGQRMTVIQSSNDEPHLFKIWYLGFESEAFVGMERAKREATTFACSVLSHMQMLVGSPYENAQSF